ncbi:unnamed protein product [Fusarium venenatum]|uniref:Uncharacterized protein n=1 Tax=Fusarium venenatum TaxID=56646 RepID=A0A2L2TKH3_9HYPO|nr:uncharacterized protein FVRRES_10636 [Fusarium venenatum]CEI70559.1 unnamed protein product [Fusarium venenatum]
MEASSSPPGDYTVYFSTDELSLPVEGYEIGANRDLVVVGDFERARFGQVKIETNVFPNGCTASCDIAYTERIVNSEIDNEKPQLLD